MKLSRNVKIYIVALFISSLFFTMNLSCVQHDEFHYSPEIAETQAEPDSWANQYSLSVLDECTTISLVEFKYAVGKAVGVDRNYGTLGFFAGACFDNQWLPFIDFKEHSINNGKWGTNIGLGIRYMDPCTCRYWGGNLFYDYRESCFKGFHQLGIGFESLGSCWDFRINAYVPLGNKDHRGPITVFDQYIGNFVVTCQPHIFALTGFDAEVGSSIWQCDCFNVYLAAGPYYYSKNEFENSWGGKCRLNFQCNDYLSCELKVSHDSIYDTCVQAILGIELPFDLFFCKLRPSCCDNSCRNNRCLGSVQRNDLIILDNTRCWTKNY
ncbi:MAG: inverse autotransporter beta domain-containing protein [Parachlamydiales bacterium]|jgi:hypothetical protein